MGTIYHVAILVLQLKPQYHVLGIGFHHEPSQGASSSPRSRHSSKCLRATQAGQPLDASGPVLTYVRGLVIPEHTFPGPYRPIIEAPHPTTTKVKSIYVRAGKSLTPPKLERNVRSPCSPYPVFNSYRGVRLANTRYTQSCHVGVL